MPRIDGARLLADLRRLAEFGRYRTGVHRPTYSPDDVASRAWLAERMREAGTEPEIDGIGNVIGRPRKPGPALLIGSHSESQNHAGWLDGALGVVYGIEIARAFAEDAASAALPIAPVAWADEEGHFGSFIGSLETVALLICLTSLVLGAGLWGFSIRGGNKLMGHRSHRIVVASLLAAAAIGGSVALVAFAFGSLQ